VFHPAEDLASSDDRAEEGRDRVRRLAQGAGEAVHDAGRGPRLGDDEIDDERENEESDNPVDVNRPRSSPPGKSAETPSPSQIVQYARRSTDPPDE
jgi:hypothetical protein